MHARPTIPGSTYLVTRRTVRRHHLLRPDALLRELVVFALAATAALHGIQVHAFCAMSTHIHLVVTDPRGVMPRFIAAFHRVVALATKVIRKWDGSIWDGDQTSLVRLETPDAINEKIAYVMANPVAAGLVRRAVDWPGAKSRVEDLGTSTLSAKRPTAWFDPRSWPDEARLDLVPPEWVGDDLAAWRATIAERVAEHEARACAEATQQGWRVPGRKQLESRSPYDRATGREELRARNPTFAAGRARDAFVAAVRALRAFRLAYRTALASWRAGMRQVLFPAGTWLMARLHGALVATW